MIFAIFSYPTLLNDLCHIFLPLVVVLVVVEYFALTEHVLDFLVMSYHCTHAPQKLYAIPKD